MCIQNEQSSNNNFIYSLAGIDFILNNSHLYLPDQYRSIKVTKKEDLCQYIYIFDERPSPDFEVTYGGCRSFSDPRLFNFEGWLRNQGKGHINLIFFQQNYHFVNSETSEIIFNIIQSFFCRDNTIRISNPIQYDIPLSLIPLFACIVHYLYDFSNDEEDHDIHFFLDRVLRHLSRLIRNNPLYSISDKNNTPDDLLRLYLYNARLLIDLSYRDIHDRERKSLDSAPLLTEVKSVISDCISQLNTNHTLPVFGSYALMIFHPLYSLCHAFESNQLSQKYTYISIPKEKRDLYIVKIDKRKSTVFMRYTSESLQKQSKRLCSILEIKIDATDAPYDKYASDYLKQLNSIKELQKTLPSNIRNDSNFYYKKSPFSIRMGNK